MRRLGFLDSGGSTPTAPPTFENPPCRVDFLNLGSRNLRKFGLARRGAKLRGKRALRLPRYALALPLLFFRETHHNARRRAHSTNHAGLFAARRIIVKIDEPWTRVGVNRVAGSRSNQRRSIDKETTDTVGPLKNDRILGFEAMTVDGKPIDNVLPGICEVEVFAVPRKLAAARERFAQRDLNELFTVLRKFQQNKDGGRSRNVGCNEKISAPIIGNTTIAISVRFGKAKCSVPPTRPLKEGNVRVWDSRGFIGVRDG
jgi:hypothetical protein